MVWGSGDMVTSLHMFTPIYIHLSLYDVYIIYEHTYHNIFVLKRTLKVKYSCLPLIKNFSARRYLGSLLLNTPREEWKLGRGEGIT